MDPTVKSLIWLSRNIEKVFAVVISIVMTVVLFLQVLSRYVFNLSITWSEELSIFLLIWLTYIGASMAVMQRRHLRITMLAELLPKRAFKIVDIVSNVVFLGFMLFIAHGTYNLILLAKRTKQMGASTGIPRWVVFTGLLLAYILMMIRLVQDTVRHYRELKTMEADAPAESSIAGQ